MPRIGIVIGALFGCYSRDDAADGVTELVGDSLSDLSQYGLQLCESVFDRFEVRAVVREVEQAHARSLDRGLDACALVTAEIVHDDDVAVLQLRVRELIDIGLDGDAVDRSVQHHRRNFSAGSQRGDEGRCFPMSMRDRRAQAFAARWPTARSGHLW